MRYAAAILSILIISGCITSEIRVVDSCPQADCNRYDRTEDNDLRTSFISMLENKVDSRQMTPEVMQMGITKFDEELRVKDARSLLQYKALIEMDQLNNQR